MQKTLEILKSEDGLIIKRLSHKKLLFVYKVPILIGSNSSVEGILSDNIIVDYFPMKIRYRINNELVYEYGYRRCGINKSLIVISQKYGIIRNKICILSKRKVINIQGKDYSFDDVVDSLVIFDPIWIRDHKLNNLI